MVACSNMLCAHGKWYHYSCVEMEDAPIGDWWCSAECRRTKNSEFCICQKVDKEKTLITCAKGEDCNGAKLYHKECIDFFASENQEGINYILCYVNLKNVPFL